jgi:hypothetical protein
MDCAGSMPHPAGSDPCPCCPDDPGSAACLGACSASVGAIASFGISIPRITFDRLPSPLLAPLALVADPPLKPPPIV